MDAYIVVDVYTEARLDVAVGLLFDVSGIS